MRRTPFGIDKPAAAGYFPFVLNYFARPGGKIKHKKKIKRGLHKSYRSRVLNQLFTQTILILALALVA
jgi:hypothetical protein